MPVYARRARKAVLAKLQQVVSAEHTDLKGAHPPTLTPQTQHIAHSMAVRTQP